jgi:hypothetical protein
VRWRETKTKAAGKSAVQMDVRLLGAFETEQVKCFVENLCVRQIGLSTAEVNETGERSAIPGTEAAANKELSKGAGIRKV